MSRNWLATKNNPDTSSVEDYLAAWKKVNKCTYVTGQLEKGKEGTVHIQFFMNFDDKVRITHLQKHDKTAHYEIVRVNNGADKYCNKEDTRIEGPWSFGVLPATKYIKGDTQRRNMELIAMGPIKALEEGIISIKDYARVKQGINAYLIDKQEPYEHPLARGIWIWGPSGTGKSHDARHKFTIGSSFIKPQNKWFDGYKDQKTIILDDHDEDFLGHYLKIWMDHYSCTGEVKGGTVPLQHERFIVTSNKSIEELFVNKPHMIEPIRRRCKVHHYTEPFKFIGVQPLAKL